MMTRLIRGFRGTSEEGGIGFAILLNWAPSPVFRDNISELFALSRIRRFDSALLGSQPGASISTRPGTIPGNAGLVLVNDQEKTP